jgi:hypothetical protein
MGLDMNDCILVNGVTINAMIRDSSVSYSIHAYFRNLGESCGVILHDNRRQMQTGIDRQGWLSRR